MSITFTSWTACDHPTCPTLDWSSVEAIRNKLHWVYYEAIAQAYYERLRWQQVGVTSRPANLQIVENSYIPANLIITHIPAYREYWYSPTSGNLAFADQTLSTDGDWTGVTSFPVWTESSLLAALGVESFNEDRLLSAEWLYEQHQMLNLMRYTIETPVQDSAYTNRKSTPQLTNPDDTWANLLSAWDAAGWSYAYTNNVFGVMVERWSGGNKLAARRSRGPMTSANDQYTGAYHVDSVWSFFNYPGGFPENAIFECNDFDAEYQKYAKVLDIDRNNDAKINCMVADIEGLNIGEFTTSEVEVRGWYAQATRYVRDYYCDGGAVFRPPEEEEEEEEE